jgi:hypothetical protein
MIPEKDSDDPAIQEARGIFESFPPGLQRALESGSLEEVNKVLGKMSVEEAEEIVQKLGEVHPLSSFRPPKISSFLCLGGIYTSSLHLASDVKLMVLMVIGRHAFARRANNRCHDGGGTSTTEEMGGAGGDDGEGSCCC